MLCRITSCLKGPREFVPLSIQSTRQGFLPSTAEGLAAYCDLANWLVQARVGTKVMPPGSPPPETKVTLEMKLAKFRGYVPFTKLRLYFHKVSFIINPLFFTFA